MRPPFCSTSPSTASRSWSAVLQFDVLNGAFDITGDGIFAFADLTFGFRVSALDPALRISDNSLAISAALLINETLDLGVGMTETITDASGNSLGDTAVEISFLDGVGQTSNLFDYADFAPWSEVFVITNILVWTTNPGETASLTQFTQRFSQGFAQAMPEPATLTLLSLGLIGIGFACRCRR